MAKEDNRYNKEDEDCIIRGSRGEVIYKFRNLEEKLQYLSLERKVKTIIGEGYRCGHCAAHPCFRGYEDMSPARALPCFQYARLCREECDLFICGDPGISGKCRKDNSQVKYGEKCHIQEVKGSKNITFHLPDDLSL